MHDEFTGEGQDDNVESDESNVLGTFAVVERSFRVGADGGGDERVGRIEWVRKEDGGGEGICGIWVDSVEGEDDKDGD